MDTKGKKIKNPSKLNQLLNSPIRLLSKVTNFYVKSMAMCDAQMRGYVGGFGCPAYCPTVLPRSFSVSSGNGSHDMSVSELERTTRSPARAGRVKRVVMAWSYSVGVVRIDEDEVCEFKEDVLFRTRSCVDAVRMKKRLVAP